MDIIQYVKPELLVVAVVLYFLGEGIKKSQIIKNKYIPLINGAVGIILCGIYVLATGDGKTSKDVAMMVFTVITQGILAAGLSTYVDQIIKQSGKTE